MDGITNTETVTERLRMLMPRTPLRELQYSDNDDGNDNDNNDSDNDNDTDTDNDNDNNDTNAQGSDEAE